MSTETAHLEPYEPTQDERTLACVSHLAIFVSTIGLLVAIGLWLYVRSKYPYAAFQAAQAMIYQVVVMVLTFIVVIGALGVFFGVFGLSMAGGADPDSAGFAVGAAVFTILFVGLVVLVTLVLYVYAIYAAVRAYQGRPFRIPGIAAIADMIDRMPAARPEGSSR